MAENLLKSKLGQWAQKLRGFAKRLWAKLDPRFVNTSAEIVGEVLSTGLSLLIVCLGTISVLMSRPSVDLKLFKPYYEQQLKSAFSGRTANIETNTARWIQDRQAIEFHAAHVDIIGEDGTHQEIADIRAELSFRSGSWAKPKLTKLHIDGGALTIARKRDGQIQIGLGTPDTFERVVPLWSSNPEKTKVGNTQVGNTKAGSAETSAVGALESLTAHAVQLFVLDEASQLSLSIEGMSGDYSFDGNTINIESHGQLISGKDKAPFRLELQTVPDRSSFFARFAIEGVRPIDIAPTRGTFTALANLDAPVTLKGEVKSVAEGGLQDLKLFFSAGEGRLKTGTSYKPFSHARIQADYDVPAQSVALSDISIESEALNIEAEGAFKNIGSAQNGFMKDTMVFDLAVEDVRINPGKRFDGPIKIKSGDIRGGINLAARTLKLDAIKLDFGNFQTDVNASVQGQEGGGFTALNVDGVIDGSMRVDQILAFWPKDFALGARNWMVKSLQTADFSKLKVHVALDDNDIRNRRIEDEHLNIGFEVDDVNIRYLRKMPWLRDGAGYGVLQGNQFVTHLTAGHVDGLEIEKGTVLIPRLSPHGGDFTIDLEGRGTITEMLRISNFEPFEYADRFGLDPDEFEGTGTARLQITRPLLEHFDPNRILYELTGDFIDVSIPAGYGKHTLNDGRLSLHANKSGAEINGPVKLGKWQTALDWHKRFEIPQVSAQYTLSGTIARDDLDNFGVGLRRHFGGEIDVVLQGQGDGFDVQAANISADFTNADVNIGSLWGKAQGEAGLLTGRLVIDAQNNGSQGGGRLENFTIKAPGLSFAGSVALSRNFQLESLDISNAYIENFIEAKLKAKPTPQGVLALDIDGKYLNITTWVDKAFRTQSSSVTAPILMTASLETLELNENYRLGNATALFSHNGVGVEHAKLSGETKGGPFLAEIKRDEGQAPADGKTPQQTPQMGRVLINVPDASHAALALLGIDSIRDGVLRIDGQLPLSGEKRGLSGTAILTDFTLVRAHVFAQILSLASLQGLADTLSGGGMKFEVLEMDFSLEDGAFKIRNGRASGPALGLTGEGDIRVDNQTLDFNGVLVPAYTVNSLLADIPLLGDIVVGKKGEGIFALNYTVKGPFKATQVSVNPLSALTPGFLRRIFDVKRDDIMDPNIKELIEEQKQ